MLALLPPQKTGVLTYGDTAGNLGATEAWDIPASDGGRSSLIRREMLDDGHRCQRLGACFKHVPGFWTDDVVW